MRHFRDYILREKELKGETNASKLSGFVVRTIELLGFRNGKCLEGLWETFGVILVSLDNPEV